MNGYTNDQRERNGSGENNGAVKAPANARGEGDEKIGEPDGDFGGTDEQENDERREIHNQRQMPTALAEKFLGGNDHQSKNEIPEQEDERQIVSADMLELEQVHNRQDQKNGPGVGNLPLEVTAFCGIRLHAFGEPGLTYSV